MNLSHTRVSGLTLEEVGDGFWQHCTNTNAWVGPQYPNLEAAMRDTRAFAVRAGWMKAEDISQLEAQTVYEQPQVAAALATYQADPTDANAVALIQLVLSVGAA